MFGLVHVSRGRRREETPTIGDLLWESPAVPGQHLHRNEVTGRRDRETKPRQQRVTLGNEGLSAGPVGRVSRPGVNV